MMTPTRNEVAGAYEPAIADGRACFPETVKAQAPKGMTSAIEAAAQIENTTRAEFIRRSLLTALAAKGVTLRRGLVVVGSVA